MASAVPQEPAPSTATGASRRARALTLLTGLELSRGEYPSVGLTRLRLVGRVQGVEVDRRQQELREAALAHELRDRRARVGEEDPGAHGADRALEIAVSEIADDEQARLLDLDEEDGHVADLGRHGDGEHYFAHVGPERGGAGLQIEADLRVPVAIDARAVG